VSALRGIVVGSISLAALQLLLSSADTRTALGDGGAGVIGALVTDATKLLDRYMDPTIPLVPDLRGKAWGSGSISLGAPAGTGAPTPAPGTIASGTTDSGSPKK